jgi:hypothetical protein
MLSQAMKKMNLLKQLLGKIEQNTFKKFDCISISIAEIINVRMRSPWLWPDFIFNNLPIGREHTRLLKILHGFSRKVVLLFSPIHIFVLFNQDY